MSKIKYDKNGNCIGYEKSEWDNLCANCNCNKNIHQNTYVAVRHESGIKLIKCSDCNEYI